VRRTIPGIWSLALAYLSLYRKYRSQTFSDLMGQDHVVRTLQNAIGSGRIAHSYLFTGPRGTGKTSSARLLAKALCCEKGPTPEPCNECHICQAITEGTLVDVYEMDAASESGVDDVRDTIVEVCEYKPNIARYKVFIIDEVHDLSSKAFDALLKTVEEPPEHVIFVLATTEFNKVPPTIRSRCQKFEFHRASLTDLVTRLAYVAEREGVQAEPAALTAIARMADGGYRDALTLLEQAILTSEGKITLQNVYDQLGLINDEVVDEILLALRDGDIPRLVATLDEVARLGRDPRTVLESMLHRMADLTRAILGIDVGASTDAAREASTHETAVRLGRDELLRQRAAIADAHKVIRDVSLPRLWLEAELTRIALAPRAGAQAVVQPVRSRPASAVAAAAEPKEPEQHSPEPAKPELPEPGPPESTGAQADAGPWPRILRELPENAPITMKLSDSRLLEIKDGQATVELKSRMFCDWMTEKPQRLAFLQSAIKAATGEEWQVKFVPAQSNGSGNQPITVELPLEGQPLHKAAQAQFNS